MHFGAGRNGIQPGWNGTKNRQNFFSRQLPEREVLQYIQPKPAIEVILQSGVIRQQLRQFCVAGKACVFLQHRTCHCGNFQPPEQHFMQAETFLMVDDFVIGIPAELPRSISTWRVCLDELAALRLLLLNILAKYGRCFP